MKHSSRRRIIIIGSGLAAYGACLALSGDDKVDITVLDIGLQSPYPGQPNNAIPNSRDIEGSYFAYGLNDARWPHRIISERLCSSHAIGGYSKVYSGSLLKPHSQDLGAWPAASIPSAADYQEILASLKVWQRDDGLSEMFPLDHDLNLDRAKRQNVGVGLPRIAFNQGEEFTQKFDCSSAFTRWAMSEQIAYKSCTCVTHVESKSNELLVHMETPDGACTLACDTIFIGAGCINTTAIMDRSLFGLGRRSYTIKSTAILLQLYLCLFSIFEKRNKSDVDFLAARGLCHLFVEHRSRQTQGYWSHTQISHIRTALNQAKKQIPIGYLSRSIDPLLKKLRFSITSFHSDFGPRVELLSSIQKDGRGCVQRTVSVIEPPFNCPSQLVFSLKRAIMSRIRSLGLLPLPMSMRLGDWLRRNRLGGWHYGGSLPMTNSPAENYQCHPNGENKGLPGVFIIDASGFPSIPGSSVALLTMANSYRIAKSYIGNI